MPLNYPEIWLKRVRQVFTTTDTAPWAMGIEELPHAVTVMNEGADSEANVVSIATSDFDAEVLINNTTYPIAVQQYTDGTVIIQLDKYQTKQTSLSDDQIIGSSYDKIDNATKGHIRPVRRTKWAKALHAIAPAGDTANTPVLVATGPDDPSGRPRLVWADFVTLSKKLDEMETPEEGRRIVLCSDHKADVLMWTDEAGKRLINFNKGKSDQEICGFEVYHDLKSPIYTVTTKVKKAFGVVAAVGDRKASVVFSVPNVVQKTGLTKNYFSDASTDPANQTNRFNIRHYYIMLPVRAKYCAAII